jgi:dTDP-4-dehydrorhamnose 3,5-epimerase
MKFIETEISGLFVIEMFHQADERGVFVKSLHKDSFAKHGLNTSFDESFYSVNTKNVIRGMHFQNPPHEHSKLVYCTSGKLIDVILDLRKNSPSFGKTFSIELSASNYKAVYLPKGVAHGFCTLEDNTCMIYLTSTVHNPQSDAGILYNSFGFNWPVSNAIHSPRDLSFPAFTEFESPF